MAKINTTLYRKLAAQAEEAKAQGMVKLAERITHAIEPNSHSDEEEYSYNQLKDDACLEVWNLAAHVMRYYNLESVNAEKLEETILISASNMISEIENTLGVDSSKPGSLEPKVPGEDK